MVITEDIQRRTVKRLDWYLVLAALLLTLAGIAAVYSATRTGNGTPFTRHLVWVTLGIGLAVACAVAPPRLWLTHWRKGYLLAVALLVAVMFVGSQIAGAQRWIDIGPFQFQPSELAKLLLIVCLARVLVDRLASSGPRPAFWLSFAYMALPAILVFKQPDLGTATVFVGIWLGMCFVAGIPLRMLVYWLLGAGLLFGLAWEVGIIRDYQKARVVAFLDPSADPQGAGYQVIQARLAIGSGKLTGKGYLQGTHKEGEWIPVQETDFIYTVIAEEGGFVGSTILIGIYGLLMYRMWRVMVQSRLPEYRLLVAGVSSMWLYHIVVNLAMVLGLFPVVGVPLPLVSYGGTSTLVAFATLGLVAGVRAREEDIVF